MLQCGGRVRLLDGSSADGQPSATRRGLASSGHCEHDRTGASVLPKHFRHSSGASHACASGGRSVCSAGSYGALGGVARDSRAGLHDARRNCAADLYGSGGHGAPAGRHSSAEVAVVPAQAIQLWRSQQQLLAHDQLAWLLAANHLRHPDGDRSGCDGATNRGDRATCIWVVSFGGRLLRPGPGRRFLASSRTVFDRLDRYFPGNAPLASLGFGS